MSFVRKSSASIMMHPPTLSKNAYHQQIQWKSIIPLFYLTPYAENCIRKENNCVIIRFIVRDWPYQNLLTWQRKLAGSKKIVSFDVDIFKYSKTYAWKK